ncbi:TPA: Smr/MutS family protein [Candidatus Gracilibacteria bacterium]|nr:Smr/MutS family protein [Candidatus Gracilibacteria bacterium]
MSLDLHGHTSEEAEKKLLWIIEHAQYNDYICIKIITGIGKKVLKPLVRQKLKSWKSQKKIRDYIEVIDENKQRTGVFLYLV